MTGAEGPVLQFFKPWSNDYLFFFISQLFSNYLQPFLLFCHSLAPLCHIVSLSKLVPG